MDEWLVERAVGLVLEEASPGIDPQSLEVGLADHDRRLLTLLDAKCRSLPAEQAYGRGRVAADRAVSSPTPAAAELPSSCRRVTWPALLLVRRVSIFLRDIVSPFMNLERRRASSRRIVV